MIVHYNEKNRRRQVKQTPSRCKTNKRTYFTTV